MQQITNQLYLLNTTMQTESEQRLKQLFQTKQEQRVGISCFISKGHPIPAVTKFLLTDFIVNEIAENGQVIKLKQKPNPNVNPVKQAVKEQVLYEINKDLLQQISKFFGKEASEAISDLYKRLDGGQKINVWQYTIENMVDMNKQQRTIVHAFVRQKLINIQSNTLEGNKMKLKLNKKMKKINPAARNKYVHFVLFKSNIDTLGAIFKLSKLTGINQKLFSTAGLKDKRGVTTQLVSLYNTQLLALHKFYAYANKNKQIWIEGFKQHMDNDIGVGNLYGNQFGLILRLINPVDAQLIHERVESLKQFGMINYFGMQRFGSCGTKTHMIGLKILKKQWKEIVEDLLLQDTKDQQIDHLKYECYKNQQYARAQRELPNKYKIQKNIFKGLKKHGKNYQNVFESLPRSMKTLYLHSLQSYIWNRIVSRRITEFGLKLRKGDIVGKRLSGYKLAKAELQDQNQFKNNSQKIQDKQQDEQGGLEEQNEQEKYEIDFIDNQEKLLNYNITDIVFPLYGPSIILPQQSIAYLYLLDELKELNLVQQQFTKNAKQLCFKGMYRKMIVKPSNVSDKIICYHNPKDQLQSPFYLNGEELQVTGGDKKAVQVVIQLPKSSYATMALRELLHIPSSFEAQMILNKLYQGWKDKQKQE